MEDLPLTDQQKESQIRFAQKVVRSQLKAPSTAKFLGDATVSFRYDPRKDRTFLSVSGDVEAVNSYNAPLRNRYLYLFELPGRRSYQQMYAPTAEEVMKYTTVLIGD